MGWAISRNYITTLAFNWAILIGDPVEIQQYFEAIRSYYPLWAICMFYEFIKIFSFLSDNVYKCIQSSHILISLNDNS